MKIISYSKAAEEYGTETRFAIAEEDGKIIDDAQGYGYTTAQKAHKAMWYKFQGGKKKIKNKEKNRRIFFKQHIGLEEFLNDIMENNFKEICRGEVTDQDILDCVKEKFGIDMPKEYIHEQ